MKSREKERERERAVFENKVHEDVGAVGGEGKFIHR
jgi:hypothetical protein